MHPAMQARPYRHSANVFKRCVQAFAVIVKFGTCSILRLKFLRHEKIFLTARTKHVTKNE